ncbi:DUF2004 domain-containing protein [Paramicrobacterium agarici]|uniref:DUF2004 domain-containing protein n=1 Tax=Paramicrobacterium agarici TaxID=630514 RepID=A0A2A9DY64_9MICO|nr:DUF2004 domain-containing protein [Microbacterium agarici]PFG31533.1 hypothetical protein ATJ78_2503 [Microbacterium agarici]TQO21421.1 hypothetical protein FB385_0222 [Microbacterium agarici]
MGIEHDFFGVIESDASGSLYWSETVDAGDQTVDVSLSAPADTAVSDEALEVAQAMIATLEGLDMRAREALVAELGTPASDVTAFLLDIDEQFGPELASFITRESGDRDIDVLRSLELLRVVFHPHQVGEGDAFVSLEFALAPDESELALLVHLSIRGETVSTEYLD